jgi:protease I
MEIFPDDAYQAPLSPKKSSHILIVTDNKMDDLNFFYPYYRFIEEGYVVSVATPRGGPFRGERGLGLQASLPVSRLKAHAYDLLYLSSGGLPARDDNTIDFIGEFVSTGKPVVSACYGPLLLAAAGVITDRRIAAWPGIQKAIEDAGAIYVSKRAVRDGPFITARWPADLPFLMSRVMNTLNGRGDAKALSAA